MIESTCSRCATASTTSRRSTRAPSAGLNAVSRGTGLDNRDQTIAVSNVTTLSPRTLNEARFQFTRSRLDAPVNDEIGPAVNIAGVASFGTATFSPLARDIDLYEMVDNVSTQRGAHSIKGRRRLSLQPGQYFLSRRASGRLHLLALARDLLTVSALSNFLAGSTAVFSRLSARRRSFNRIPNIGLLCRTSGGRATDLTINAGLRYDAAVSARPDQYGQRTISRRGSGWRMRPEIARR